MKTSQQESKINERLLQFIWQHKLFNVAEAKSTDNEAIQLIYVGTLNTQAGPDFIEAKIKIGETLWAGNIEIHVKSSDWKKHNHAGNRNYENIILHVVLIDDEALHLNCPTLVLKPLLNESLLFRYEEIMAFKGFIACEKNLERVKSITLKQQMDRVLIERLEAKTMYIHEALEHSKSNWQEVFYIMIAKAFGLHINQFPFETLAKSLPMHVLSKHKNSLLQVEALLFGQAGLLNDYFDEAYPLQLQKEYAYLKTLHNLNSLAPSLWKFLRLRPANFPTIRIAQFAQLIYQSNQLLSVLLECNTLKEMEALFQITPSDFWNTHYTFTETSNAKAKPLGKAFTQLVLINAVIPTLFLYGKLQGKENYCEKALNFLRAFSFENNSVTYSFKQLGFPSESASDSQSLLELKKNYCDKKRCLDCSIGYSIIKHA